MFKTQNEIMDLINSAPFTNRVLIAKWFQNQVRKAWDDFICSNGTDEDRTYAECDRLWKRFLEEEYTFILHGFNAHIATDSVANYCGIMFKRHMLAEF